MDKAPESSELIRFAQTEAGTLAGTWWVPEDGFVWDDRLSPWDDRLSPAFDVNSQDKGPWLRLKRTDAEASLRRYPILRKPRLLVDYWDLAQTPSMSGVLRFANKWGRLGRSETVVLETGRFESAEPLVLWLNELLEFRAIYETWRAIQIIDLRDSHSRHRVQAAWDLLSKRIQWRADQTGVVFEVEIRAASALSDLPVGYEPSLFRGELFASVRDQGGFKLLSRWVPGDALEPARYYVYRAVNRKLQGHVNLAVLPFLQERIRFFPDDLLTGIYIHFAFELAGRRAPERVCEFCHRPFAIRRRDQRFCNKNCREAAGYHRRKGDSVGAIRADTA